MVSLLVRAGLEEFGESMHCLVLTRVLVVHELLSMVSLLVRAGLEEFGESMHCLVLTREKVSHSHIDIACVKFHVDLLVDQSFGFTVIILTDCRSHFFLLLIILDSNLI